jgi:hypothetical protein
MLRVTVLMVFSKTQVADGCQSLLSRAMFFCQASQFAPVVALSDNVNIYDVSVDLSVQCV